MSETSFAGILLADVRQAHLRHAQVDTQSSRRDLVRTIFAAIDGLSWSYRVFVRETLGKSGYIEADEVLALAEKSYIVDRTGVVSTNDKFLPTPSAIRLACRIVERAKPDVGFDFSGSGWPALLEATKIRNRVTHPKTLADLELNGSELLTCLDAFYWVSDLVASGMEACISVSRAELEWTKNFVRDLNDGDPKAWADYLHARDGLGNDD